MKTRMSKISTMAIAMLLLISVYTGCSSTGNAPDSPSGTDANPVVTETTSYDGGGAVTAIPDNLKTEDTDSAWDADTSTQIALTGATAVISGEGAAVSGGAVTITEAGTYVVSGTLSKGQILVNAAEKDTVRLVLNGADITSDTNAAIYAAEADKLVIVLADGTINTVTDVSSYTYADVEKEEPNAAVFSKCDLSINGTGSLTVNGSFDHGIATKDDLVISGGNITVKSVGVSIRGKDSVTILDGTFNLTSSGGDGLKAANDTDADKGWVLIKDGNFSITAANDGIQAFTALQIDGGDFTLQSGDDAIHSDMAVTINGGVIDVKNSNEGIEGADVNINGGEISVYATDDGINVNSESGLLTISGGDIYVNAEGDGMDSNNNIIMTGGTVHVDGPTSSGNGAIDYEKKFDISGGVLLAADNGGMSQAPSTTSAQPSIMLYYSSAQKAGTEISLKSPDGTTLCSYAPQKDYRAVVISADGMKLNETYAIYADGEKLCDATLSSSVTAIDSTGAAVSGRGGMGGGRGGMGARPDGETGERQRPDGANPPARPDGTKAPPTDGISMPAPPPAANAENNSDGN